MKVIRVVLFGVIALVGLIFLISTLRVSAPAYSGSGYSPAPLATDNLSALTEAALSNYELNSANTDNVYQQQVVAQWGIKDLVEVTARQNSTLIDNQVALADAQTGLVEAVESSARLTAASTATTTQLLKSLITLVSLIAIALGLFGVTVFLQRRDNGAPQPAEGLGESGPQV